MKRIHCWSILVLAGFCGCSPSEEDAASPDNSASPVVADIARSYRRLEAMTKEPVLVDRKLAMLCVGVSQQQVEEAQKQSGPHADTSVSIFMNEPAAVAFRQSSTTYPVGSVIVKEKHGLSYRPAGGLQKTAQIHDGVGGMIKRAPGFDSAHGDWEYFYFEDASKIESGKIASCVQCHSGAAKTDHVFGGWARDWSK